MLAPIIVKLLAIGGAALLGAGAGTGWYFTAGGGTIPAPAAPGDSPTASVSDGLFHENDLDQFLLTEEQTRDWTATSSAEIQVALRNDALAPWCLGGTPCTQLSPDSCNVLSLTGDTRVIEPLALASQNIKAAPPGQLDTVAYGDYVVMQYPTVEMARSEVDRVRAAALDCAAADPGTKIQTDESRDASTVLAGYYGMAYDHPFTAANWALVQRDNIVVRVGFAQTQSLGAKNFAPYLDHMVANANAAAPANGSSASGAPAAAPQPSTPAPAPTTASAPDFSQIKTGDYSSLAGTWTQIAEGHNNKDGKGVQYSAGGTNTLSISNTTIDVNSVVKVNGTTLTDPNGDHPLVFREDGENISGSLVDQNVSINWSVDIYPRGTSRPFDMKGTPVSNATDVIVIWTSNMSSTAIYARSEQG